ncbi:MAG: 16S rRNA processing protein RimM [Myxococcales bacterium]|nr:16S rRNA processing protein RimM [Myxococcales bacterium]USN51864.1 MAG: 16S rRNA processing protein RimM [Myxococcales bacterium]
MNDLVLIAYIAKAVGLKGALKLKLLNSQSESLRPGLKLSIRQGKQAVRQLVIEHVETRDRIYFEGVGDRTTAEALQGSEVYINHSDLPVVAPDEYYLNDVLGAEVILICGKCIGHLKDFAHNGAQDLLEVESLEGRILSIPLVPAIVKEIDEKNKRIIIDPPEGLLDLD